MTEPHGEGAPEPHDAGSEGPPEGELGEYGVPTTVSFGQVVLHPGPEQYIDTLSGLRDDGYTMCVDLTAVDNLRRKVVDLPAGVDAGRFELVVQLRDLISNRRVRLRVQLEDDEPTIPTAYFLFPGADALERETYDMFGIVFEGHPDPTRILMPEDWIGHPLRKDYEQGRIPVQFKAASNVR